MSFWKTSPFGRGKARETRSSTIVSSSQPCLSLHVPAFGGIVMKPVSMLPGAMKEDTILTGQLEVEIPVNYKYGMICNGLSVWIEGRWTDLEGSREKGNIVCFEQRGEIERSGEGELWLQPGTQRFKFTISLPSTLPRNGASPSGRLLYWLVGVIESSSDASTKHPTINTSRSPSVLDSHGAPSASFAGSEATPVQSERHSSGLPLYSDTERQGGSSERVQAPVRSERRVAISHNPNPDGGTNRLDDQLTHELPGFGTIREQVRVNEWCVGCYFPLRLTCLALSPSATLFAIRVRLVATTITTPPSTGKAVTTKETFVVLQHGTIPAPASIHPPSDFPSLWRGHDAGGDSSGDFVTDVTGKLPVCDLLRPSTLPGMHMPGVGIPIRSSHQLVYEILFSVHGQMADGSHMAEPGPGGLQLMLRSIDVVLPQCVLVSEVLDLPSYSTAFGENIRRTDEYFYHRIEANLPCHNCGVIPLHNLCTLCPRNAAPHVQHTKPKPRDLACLPRKVRDELRDGPSRLSFDPSSESCPVCSGKSILPGEDPNYHLCGCEIAGREEAYRVIWDEASPAIAKVVVA